MAVIHQLSVVLTAPVFLLLHPVTFVPLSALHEIQMLRKKPSISIPIPDVITTLCRAELEDDMRGMRIRDRIQTRLIGLGGDQTGWVPRGIG
jgi:hypothetical protein